MDLSNPIIAGPVIALSASAVGLVALHWFWQRRFQRLQRQLSRSAEDMLQMAELQVDAYKRFSRHLAEVEDRLFHLAVPSADSPLPLGRRHQVVTLAKKGLGAEEIADRLKMPRGEAELILNLRRFMDTRAADSPPDCGLRVGLRCREGAPGIPAATITAPAQAGRT